MEYRLLFLALLGVFAGAFANWAVDQMNWVVRCRSPWSRIPGAFWAKYRKSHPKTPNALKKHWFDFIPLLGWLSYKRFSPVLGKTFWIRPFFVELVCGLGLVWLYHWEVDRQMLSLVAYGMNPEAENVVHLRFLFHAVLFYFLLLATLIDFDDFIIPDTITIPGTVIGLLFAALLPNIQLPVREIAELQSTPIGILPVFSPDVVGLNVASPHSWPEIFAARTSYLAITIAVACWWLWCFAMMNRVWRLNFGLKHALALFFRRLRRSPSTWIYLLAGLGGSILIIIPWFGGVYWHGTFSGIVGMAVGGGIIWGVRLIGSWCLGREAMGFGDVTFMAMIGAFVGWQPCLFIFFLAPIAGLVLGLSRYALGLGKEIPYGPFLALGTVIVVLFWPKFWFKWGEMVFYDVWLVPAMIVFCAVMFAVLLGLLGLMKKQRLKSDIP